jgi:hypothetical protein
MRSGILAHYACSHTAKYKDLEKKLDEELCICTSVLLRHILSYAKHSLKCFLVFALLCVFFSLLLCILVDSISPSLQSTMLIAGNSHRVRTSVAPRMSQWSRICLSFLNTCVHPRLLWGSCWKICRLECFVDH